MDRDTPLENQKHLALKVGIGIVLVHFLSTYWQPSDLNWWMLAWCILMVPSFFVVFIFHPPDFFDFFDLPYLYFLFIVLSSFSYGIVGGLFASRKWYLQITGVILLLLFGLSGLYIMFWAVFVQG